MGSAFGMGWQYGAELARQNGAHGGLSDEERETKLADYNGSIQQLQTKMSQDPQNAAAYQSQLSQVIADRTDLFHPRHGAGALAHLGKMLWHSVHGGTDPSDAAATPPASTIAPTAAPIPDAKLPDGTVVPAPTRGERPQIAVLTPADEKQRLAQDVGFGAPLPQQNEIAVYRRKMIEGGFSETDADKAARIHFGLDAKPVAAKPVEEKWKRDGAPYKGADGKWYERQANQSGELRETALDDNFQPPANVKKSQFEREMDAYAKSIGKTGIDELTFDEYQTGLAGIKQAVTPSTTTTRETVQVQANGDLKRVPLTSTSSKRFPGAAATPGARAQTSGAAASSGTEETPTLAKLRTRSRETQGGARASKTAPNAATGTPAPARGTPGIVGHRNTPSQVAADKDMVTATKLVDSANDAWNHPTAAKDRQLALSIIRGTAGRVNMAEFTLYTKRFGWDNTLEQFANNATSGELPTEIRRQLVQLAHQNLHAARAGHEEAFAGTAGATPGPSATPKTYKQTATGPNSHRIGSDDGGNTWFDVQTGKKIE